MNNNATVPAGPAIDGARLARELAAQVPETPRPTEGVPPGSDPVPGSMSVLYDLVQIMVEGDSDMRELVEGVFGNYVADAMRHHGVSREQAIAEASAIVERAVSEAGQP